MVSFRFDPFIRAGIVPHNRLIGRGEILNEALSHLLNPGGSVAIDGEWLTGKSSILNILADPASYLVADGLERFGRHRFVLIDCESIVTPFDPSMFWRRVLEQLRRPDSPTAVVDEIDKALAKASLNHYACHSVLDILGQSDQQLVLLLDNFHAVRDISDLAATASFADGLRSLITRPDHKAHIVVCTHQPLTDVASSFYTGYSRSPFENYFAVLALRMLRLEEVEKLAKSYLASSEVAFTDQDVSYIHKLTGGHPNMVQIACSILYNARLEGVDANDDYQAQSFIEYVQPLFNRLWSSLDDVEKMLLMMLCLQNVKGRLPSSTYDLGDLSTVLSRHSRVLNALTRRGQIRREGKSGEEFTIFSRYYEWWILKEIESGRHEELKARERIFFELLRRDQAKKVVEALRYASAHKEAIANLTEWTVKFARRLAIAAAGAP